MEYRPIETCPGYEVSPTGVVRSVASTCPCKGGSVRIKPAKVMTPCGRGRAYVSLRIGGRSIQKNIATLTAEVWADRETGACADYRTITLREYWDMLRSMK